MFTALSERLTATLKRLTGRGVLSEQDVTEALRDIRRHLLEADVSFEVTTGFVERVRERAVGVIAVKSVSPGQQVAKLVHDGDTVVVRQSVGTCDGMMAQVVPVKCVDPPTGGDPAHRGCEQDNAGKRKVLIGVIANSQGDRANRARRQHQGDTGAGSIAQPAAGRCGAT